MRRRQKDRGGAHWPRCPSRSETGEWTQRTITKTETQPGRKETQTDADTVTQVKRRKGRETAEDCQVSLSFLSFLALCFLLFAWFLLFLVSDRTFMEQRATTGAARKLRSRGIASGACRLATSHCVITPDSSRLEKNQ